MIDLPSNSLTSALKGLSARPVATDGRGMENGAKQAFSQFLEKGFQRGDNAVAKPTGPPLTTSRPAAKPTADAKTFDAEPQEPRMPVPPKADVEANERAVREVIPQPGWVEMVHAVPQTGEPDVVGPSVFSTTSVVLDADVVERVAGPGTAVSVARAARFDVGKGVLDGGVPVEPAVTERAPILPSVTSIAVPPALRQPDAMLREIVSPLLKVGQGTSSAASVAVALPPSEMRSQVPTTLRISLRPAELGPVQVVIHTGSEGTNVRITAETDAGYAALLNKGEVLASLVRDLRSATVLPPAETGQQTLSFTGEGQRQDRAPMGDVARESGRRGGSPGFGTHDAVAEDGPGGGDTLSVAQLPPAYRTI